MIPPFYKSKRAGFTLIETLVAVALILIATTGPLASAGQSYFAAADAKNRLTASYLAQEGIEYVRMLRDSTYLAAVRDNKNDLTNTAFYIDFLFEEAESIPTSIRACRDPDGDGVADGGGVCALDPALSVGIGSGLALQLCDTGGNVNACPLLYLSSSGLYNLSAIGSPTIFRRSIQFYDLGPDEEVVVTVSWNFKGAHTIVLTDYLSPWQ